MYSIYIYKLLLINVSVSLIVSEVLPHMTGASGSPPPSPPTPHRNYIPTSSPNSSPDRMPSLRDRAVFFVQATFDGKDKTKLLHIYKVLKIL